MATNKSLQDSFIFKSLNTNNRINTDVTELVAKGTRLTKDNMQEAFLTITKRFDYSLKNKVLEAIDNGDIVMMFSPEGVKLPSTLPFFLLKTPDNKIKVIVAVDTHGSMNKETKDITIDAKKLYVTLEAAYISLQHFKNLSAYSNRTNILSTGANIYSNMITRCLNRKYALNTDKNKLHKVQFIAAKFFIMSICRYENEALANSYAAQVCVGANNLILKDLADNVLYEDIQDIEGMINTLKRSELNIGVSDLTVRGFLEMYINMYHHSALLGLELFPYFVYTINSAVHGAYINNQNSLEDIIDKVGPKFYVSVAGATH